MPSSEIQEDGSHSGELDSGERIYTVMAATSGVGLVFAVSFVGLTTLDSLSYGLVAGLMMGGGSFLFLPWFLRLSAMQENTSADVSNAELIDRVPGNPQQRVAGLGLEIGGIVMFAVGLTLDEPVFLYGAGAGIAVALVVFLVASVVVGRLDPQGH